jgi:hypothetical protein
VLDGIVRWRTDKYENQAAAGGNIGEASAAGLLDLITNNGKLARRQLPLPVNEGSGTGSEDRNSLRLS